MPRAKGRSRKPSWWAALGVLAYTAFLVVSPPGGGAAEPPPPTLSIWELPAPRALLDRMWEVAEALCWRLLAFVPLGILLPLALPRADTRLARLATVLLPGVILGAALSVAVVGFQLDASWEAPGVRDALLPVLGCVLGVWAGTHLVRGLSGVLLFVPKLALLLAVCAALPLAGLYLATEPEPLPIDGAEVTSQHKRDLVRLLEESNPATLDEGETRELTLTTRDLDVLLAWALSVVGRGAEGQVEAASERLDLRASAPLPFEIGRGRYLNLALGLGGGVRAGELDLSLDELRVGDLSTPGWLSRLAAAFLAATLRSDRAIGPIIGGIDELRVDPDAVRVEYGRMDLKGELLPRLIAELGPGEAVLASARAQIENLAAAAPGLAPGDARFGACLETTFAFAAERARDGSARVENRGAVLALGTVLGHPRLATAAGLESEREAIRQLRRQLGQVTLRQRADWTKHFLLSAGLAALSDTATSDAVGLLKEELDADTDSGGSGFSFADLLADRAGTRFTWAATASEERAGAMQARLAGGFLVDDFFPDAEGLPEGITAGDFDTQYGGVGGSRYALLTESIERRLGTCAAYR